jgi:uncharacterized protein YhdP
VKATARLEGVAFSPWQKSPGVSGLSGQLSLDGPVAELAIDSSDLMLTWPHLFRQPLALQTMRGTVLLKRDEEQWRISGEALQLANQDARAAVSFDSWFIPGTSPLLSLQARIEEAQAAAVSGYLPAHVMSAATVQWLDKAFVQGRVASGQVLLHGRLDAFPYRQPQGQFEVVLDARNVTLHYQDGWPELTQVNGEVRFSGPSMVIDAPHARLYSSRLRKVRTGIADFLKPVLQVEGEVDATLADTLRFVQESPLLNEGEGVLGQMRSKGETQIGLALAIPLSSKVVRTNPLTVMGKATFKGTELQVTDGVLLSELSGDLLFTETGFESKELRGRLYDFPLKLQVFTELPGEKRQVVVAAQGRASARALQRELDFPLIERLAGETEWQSRLTIPYGRTGVPMLDVHSPLTGMAVDLPQPAAKERDEVRPLSLTWPLGGDAVQTHRLVYGELVNALWQQQKTPFKLLGAAVNFGMSGEPVPMQAGIIRIGGRLENLHFKEWLQLRGVIGNSAADGVATLPLELDMQRLHLVPSTTVDGGGEPLHVRDLVPIRFVVDSFSYGDTALGRTELMLRPVDSTLLIDSLKLTAPSFHAEGQGQWQEGGNTRMELRLTSGDFGRMMRELGFASVITGGKVASNGQLEWPGSPMDFSLSRLTGQVHVTIDDGRMQEVKPGAGKLLGLLSLQALPRRLILDFSDLSDKGLQFTTLEGDIRFAGGDAYTRNLHIESLPANILITGRTGLVERDFDQLITVVPNVSDTVSVAGALAWGPQTAAVLMVLQKLFQSNIDAASMTRYQLSGSWDEPKLTRLDDEKGGAVDSGL